MTVLSREQRRAKLRTLTELEGFASLTELLDHASGDSVCPAICSNEGCDYSAEMEPDQDAGWCEECKTRSMQSALILAGVI